MKDSLLFHLLVNSDPTHEILPSISHREIVDHLSLMHLPAEAAYAAHLANSEFPRFDYKDEQVL